jgi:hypothetical protein
MPQKLQLNQFIDFILNSEPEIITLICTIAITHVLSVKFNISDCVKAVRELDYFFEEMDIIYECLYNNVRRREPRVTSVETANESN